MSHPYARHNEVAVGKRRANKLVHGNEYKRGGAVHDDEAADRKLIKSMMAEHEKQENKVEGKKSGGRIDRYARGGKVKHNHTNIAIVLPHHGAPPPGAPVAAAAPSPPMPPPAGAAPVAPAPSPMMGGAPGMPPRPPMVPPGMPMRARGGKVMHGEATKPNIKAWSKRAADNSYARGGGLPTAGAESGVGRLQKARHAK